jgi:uracil-DNA glycosylase family 4
MRSSNESQNLSRLLTDIHTCRLCPSVVPRVVSRSIVSTWDTRLILMAQAPSEHGVRESGVHWVDSNGNLRPPGGTFLETYLRRIGYSISPSERNLPRPYTTNVLQCWPGAGGKRDRAPKLTELLNCSRWWKTELQFLRPQAVLLLGRPSANAFGAACDLTEDFATLLEAQGKSVVFAGLSVPIFTVPHPTAPYRGSRGSRSAYYELAFASLKSHLASQSEKCHQRSQPLT